MTFENSTGPQRTATPIDAIAEDWVDTEFELHPEKRVIIGRPGDVGEFTDYSPEGSERAAEAARRTLASIRSAVPEDVIDVVTQTDMVRVLELALEKHEAGFSQWDLNNVLSPVQALREVFDLSPMNSEQDWAAIASRMHNLPAAMDGYIRTLREGISTGNTPAIRQVREVITQAGKHAKDSGFFGTLAKNATAAGMALPDSLRSDLLAGAREAEAAHGALVDFLTEELAPHAREKDAVGRDVYAIASRYHVGAAVDLDETYEWGIEELASMIAQQEAAAREIRAGASVEEAVAFLDEQGSHKIHGTDALQRWMQETSDAAIVALSREHFHIPEEMRRLECLIAPTQEGGIYYTEPTDDFSRPGRMWWSVPEGVTEFDSWRELTTVHHEGVPGHHLQIGQAVYNKANLNSWRRTNSTSGYAEGWALYAEKLMGELGFLSDPANLLGMLDGQRMRAARVVLDIGVHLEKTLPDGSGPWTGDYAFHFFAQHVNMNPGFIRFEVNRYLGLPGQAPSYKIGQRSWEQLRAECARREGAAFDVKAFHRRALDVGGVGLDTLRAAMLA